jgi:hypothetical protein
LSQELKHNTPFFLAVVTGGEVKRSIDAATITSQAAAIDRLTFEQYDTRWSPLLLMAVTEINAPHPYIRWIPLDPNHDATIRIECEAPKQQQPILCPGLKEPCALTSYCYLGSFLAISSLSAPECQNLIFLLSPCW